MWKWNVSNVYDLPEAEFEEAIEQGELGYCDFGEHWDFPDAVHGYDSLGDTDENVSVCDDCEDRFRAESVKDLLEQGMSPLEVLERIHSLVILDKLDPGTALQLVNHLRRNCPGAAEHVDLGVAEHAPAETAAFVSNTSLRTK